MGQKHLITGSADTARLSSSLSTATVPLQALHRICRTGLYLERGRLKNFGKMEDILAEYQADYQTRSAATET